MLRLAGCEAGKTAATRGDGSLGVAICTSPSASVISKGRWSVLSWTPPVESEGYQRLRYTHGHRPSRSSP